MISIAWRNLTRERTRLAISVGGVTLAVVLILLLRGVYAGFIDESTRYFRGVQADVWVAAAGTPGDFFRAGSFMPVSAGERLRAVEGTAEVTAVLSRSVLFEQGRKQVDFLLVGVDPARPVAGPPEARQGARVPRRGEIVVDQVFARTQGIALGDTVSIAGVQLRVTGIAGGGNLVISQLAWVDLSDARRLLGLPDVVNYFLVDGAPGRDASELAARIRSEMPGVNAFTKDEFADANVADLREGFLPVVLILVVVGFVIGTAVIGQTIYTATLDKRREYGVLKAIGFSSRRLFTIVYIQSLAAGALGLVLGVGVTFALAAALRRLVPSFVTTIGPADIALVAVAALLMSVLASFVPLRPVARLEPAAVFRV